MNSMRTMLYQAAKEGNVATLLEILGQDPLILDRLITDCVAETPLHIASMLGHLDFVKEILRQKPEMVMGLDSQRSSALHLASAKGYVEVVKELLRAGPEMCLACDAEGRNPLHLAAMKGHVSVLEELVRVNSQAAREKGGFGESILHLCVKHKQLKALKSLVGIFDDYQFVNVKDHYGMTILHRAVVEKPMEIITFLLERTRIEVNAVNTNGFTALDILAQSGRDVRDFEIGESLRRAGGTTASTPNISRLTKPRTVEKEKKKKNWLGKKRETLMVVAILIATMAFQAALTPPAGLWQDDNPDHSAGSSEMADSPDHSAGAQSPLHPIYNLPRLGLRYGSDHSAGSSIMADKYHTLYSIYLISNTMSFVSSLSIILLLITGLPFAQKFFMWLLTVIMWISITAMALTYIISIMVSTGKQDLSLFDGKTEGYYWAKWSGTPAYVALMAIVVWIGLMTLVLLMHTIKQLAKLITFLFHRFT